MEVYPLGEKSLGADSGSEIGSFSGGSYGSGYGNLEKYPSGKNSFGAYGRSH